VRIRAVSKSRGRPQRLGVRIDHPSRPPATLVRLASLIGIRKVATIAAAAAVLVSLSADSAVAWAHTQAAAGCPRSRILAADASIEIYLGPNKLGDTEVFGCAYGSRRHYLLGARLEGSSSGTVGLTSLAVGGTYAAYGYFSTPNPETSEVIVRNMRTGRTLHKLPTGPSAPPNIGDGPTTDVVVTASGEVAWINQTQLRPRLDAVSVFKGAASRVLATGSEIGPTSLALAGDILYWSQGGMAFGTSIL